MNVRVLACIAIFAGACSTADEGTVFVPPLDVPDASDPPTDAAEELPDPPDEICWACAEAGDPCQASYHCVSGMCRVDADAGGDATCADAVACAASGESCETVEDCCPLEPASGGIYRTCEGGTCSIHFLPA